MNDLGPPPPAAFDPGDGVADSLVAELEAGGELVDAGGFTIDGARARARLRDHLLADAHAYALLLVEAAVLGGAEPVTVTTEDAKLCVGLGPLRLDRSELDNLFAAVFVSLDGLEGPELRRTRSMQVLAYACNTALSLDIEAIVIETRCPSPSDAAGAGGLRLRLSPGDDAGILEEIEPEELAELEGFDGPGTRVLVDYGGQSVEREANLIRERCQLSLHAVELDGVRVSRGFSAALDRNFGAGFSPSPRKVTKVVVDGEVVGRAGLRYSDKAPAELNVVVNGVLAERIDLGTLGRPGAPDFVALVDVDLPRDLGYNKLLRGPDFDAVVAAVWEVHDRIAPADFDPAAKPLERRPVPVQLGFAFGVMAVMGVVIWLVVPGSIGTLIGVVALVAGVIGAIVSAGSQTQ